MPRRVWIVGAAALVLALVVAGLLRWRGGDRTSFAWATERAPAGTQRFSWTDWEEIRADESADLSATSSVPDLRHFLSRAFDDDLSSTSALVQSAPVLQERFGFSPATADWELFSQSYQGAVVMLHLPSSTDFTDVADHLRELGYTQPTDATGVWDGGDDRVAEISPSLTPELAYVALDAHDSVVLTSDASDYLDLAMKAVTGDGDRATGVGSVVDDAGEPLSSAVYTGDYACGALAMGHADVGDQAQARQLLAAAGEVNPYSAFAMSDEPDGSVRVALEFDSSDVARTNADTRATLARGPAPGQGGSFRDRFSVDSVTAHDALVVMRLTPEKGAYVLSDLSTGPLLFAAC